MKKNKHHKRDFIKSEHELFVNRKGMLHRLKSDASSTTDPSRDTISVEDTRGIYELERLLSDLVQHNLS
jgi:hypothetical protein